MTEPTRKLAAIMFTDIVGYTSLMGKDSKKALDLVRRSKDIQKPLVEKFNGKWLKEMGDGAMAQFNTALDAVNCAVHIQRVSRADFDADIRIGIHLGDITLENNDVYGDGVNVASRLESIADPGGVYVSESIERATRGQTDIQAKYIGEVNLKNVDYGVRTYALQGTGLPVPDLKDSKGITGRFFAEIERRGVARAGVIYILLSLLFILVLPYFQSWLDLPTWSKPVLITFLGFGFPIALYLAWRYERSPEGFIRTTSDKSWQNPLNARQRKPLTGNYIMGGLILFIALLYVLPENKPENKPETSPENTIVEVSEDDKSIAVLPFVNMSNDPDQDYFSDGMMEEILNHLFKIGDLQVTSRTSAMQYKGTNKSITEIAKELGVSTILEGSVRKSGNRVRITVQLIDGQTDKHLWAETYDRNLSDIFAIQSEVAQTIATTLQAEIQPEVRLRIESQPTDNTDAYNLYLEALKLNAVDDKENKQAIAILEEVTKLDPNFSRAYVALGYRLQTGATYLTSDGRMDPATAWIISKPYFDKALELDPDNGEAHMRMAWSTLWFDWNFEGARIEYEETKRIFPNYSWTDYLVTTENFKQAAKEAEKSVEIDPTNGLAWSSIILAQYFSGDHEKALQNIENALSDSLSWVVLTLSESARVSMYLGQYEKALAIINKIYEGQPGLKSPRIFAIQAICEHYLGNDSIVTELMDKLEENSSRSAGGSPAFYLAMMYAVLGDVDESYKWLDKSYEEREVEMYWLKVEPPFEPIRSDPRWQGMLDKVGFPK